MAAACCERNVAKKQVEGRSDSTESRSAAMSPCRVGGADAGKQVGKLRALAWRWDRHTTPAQLCWRAGNDASSAKQPSNASEMAHPSPAKRTCSCATSFCSSLMRSRSLDTRRTLCRGVSRSASCSEGAGHSARVGKMTWRQAQPCFHEQLVHADLPQAPHSLPTCRRSSTASLLSHLCASLSTEAAGVRRRTCLH